MNAWKVLTLHQPWASLVSLGVKSIETRSWSTKYRGPLAIHAAASENWREGQRVGDWLCYRRSKTHQSRMYCRDHNPMVLPLPLGVIVATATLVDVVPMFSWAPLNGPAVWAAHMIPKPGSDAPRLLLLRSAESAAESLRDEGPLPAEIDATDQLLYGDFAPGRFAWLLADVVPVDPPVPFKGGQGLTKTWIP